MVSKQISTANNEDQIKLQKTKELAQKLHRSFAHPLTEKRISLIDLCTRPSAATIIPIKNTEAVMTHVIWISVYGLHKKILEDNRSEFASTQYAICMTTWSHVTNYISRIPMEYGIVER